MKKNKRFKAYLLLCVIVYFVLSLVVLFYSFGYKYDIKNKKTIQTGAILIKTNLKNVNLYINGKPFKNTKTISNLFDDFIRIENLLPSAYNIKIKKDNYFVWEKNLNVKNGRITEIKNIVLFKKDCKKNDLLITKIDLGSKNMWLGNNNGKIVYKNKRKDGLGLMIFDLKNKNHGLVVDLDKLQSTENKNDYNLEDVIWFDNDKKIMIKTNDSGGCFYYIIDLEEKNKIYNLGYIFEKDCQMKYQYDFDLKNDSIFYLKNNTLYEFVYKRSLSKKMLADVSGFLSVNGYIYYLKTDDNGLYYTNYNDSSAFKKILAMPDNFDLSSPSKIIRSGKNTYLILSGSGKLYFIGSNNSISLINSSVKNAYFSNNDERIVYYNNNEIWIYYIKEKISQPPKKEFANELVTRYSRDINNIFLYKDEEHLFYKEGNIFKFIELDNRDKKNVFDVLELENNDVYYVRENNSLIYAKDNKLMAIDLEEKD